MRFRVEPRDVPPEHAARRLGLTLARFEEVRERLFARGFPRPDELTGHYDLTAVDRWCDARHPALFGLTGQAMAVDSGAILSARIAKMRSNG